jgi:CheY-like chemotaxis protein
LKAVSGSQPTINRESTRLKLERSGLVLLAEDNKTNQLIAKSLLEQVGIDVIVANDGKEAVDLYEEHRDNIDLILMDLHMPVMNGYEAAERIREYSTKIPIVAMTADVVLGVRDRCEQSGIYNYISKPFNPDSFIQTIKDIILKDEQDASVDTAVLDRQLGLKNMGDNKELYLQVLKEYSKENQDTLDMLEAAVREKRYDDAAQIVHKIKSSSGTMVALISLVCFKQDKDVGVVIPYTAPNAIEKMAEFYQSSVIRSKTKKRAMMEEVIRIGDSSKRKAMERFILYFDGLATVMGIMDLMTREDKGLAHLVEDLPKIHMSIRDIECPWSAKGKVMRSLIDEANRRNSDIELYEGIKINDEKGWALILPDPDEPLVKVYSEGFSEEYAEELSDFYEKRINGIKEE